MKQITGHTGLTGLFGSPVAHSISPMMHNASFEHLGLDYVYLATGRCRGWTSRHERTWLQPNHAG